MCFVTTAAQEPAGAELALIIRAADARRRRRQVDGRIADLTRGHLKNAGLGELPVIEVSSLLRMEAKRDPELNAESGFAKLVEFLARDVVAGVPGRALAASRARPPRSTSSPAQLEQQTTGRAR